MSEGNAGKRIYDLCGRIFPICRSITGDGVRETLHMIDEHISDTGHRLNVTELPTGTQVFDWTVPKEWRVRDAYIEDEAGKRIIDFKDNNLHVMGYSLPVDEWVDLEGLGGYVYTQPDQPDVIPYVTSYYKGRAGFCMSESRRGSLKPGKYHLYVDSELFDGCLTYADLVIPGETEDEILITSYTCHPSMANNECSGPALLAELVRYICGLRRRRHTYRFVLNPETIGAIAYLATEGRLEHLKRHLAAGVVLSCVGDDGDFSIVHSRDAGTLADRSLASILRARDRFKEYSFLERGSDERQYNAPGIGLPVVGFCRTRYGEFPEYHTSGDDMDFVSPAGFQGAYEAMTQWIDCMEHNLRYKVTVLGEPQLGKRGLYPTVSQKGGYDGIKAMMNLIAYADGRNDLFDIAEAIGESPHRLLPIIEKMVENGLMEWEG